MLLVALLLAGCGKQEQRTTPAATQLPSNRVVLATHWIGKTLLAQDTNAAYQMEIWSMPESERLETQTLDKLARALPILLGVPGGGDTNVLTGALRPLLDDLLQSESFSELRATTNWPTEFALAIRLSAERAALWQAGVAMLQQAFSGPNSNSAPLSHAVRFSIAGDWVVLGTGTEDATLFNDFVRRFGTAKPMAMETNRLWVELDVDLEWLLASNSIFSNENLPFVHLTLLGEGQSVRTRGELAFPKPPEIQLEPWNVPTNLIHDPLVSFTAVRGMRSWVAASPVWSGQSLGSAPDQVYSWALGDIPFRTYLAAMWPESSNRFYQFSDRLLQDVNPQFATNDLGRLERLPNLNGLTWKTVPFFNPFLQHESLPMGEAVFGGFFAPGPDKRPIPPELVAQLYSQSKLVYYDWEITQPRVEQLTYLVQLLRLLSDRAQAEGESAGVKWFQAIAPKLGNTITAVTQTGPERLSISRSSSAGFTGFELHLLADWLESPNFPRGLHTSDAPVKISLRKKPAGVPGTNLPPILAPGSTNRP